MPGGYVGSRPKDESKLSTEPHQVRNRLRRALKKNPGDGRILRDIEKLYQKPVSEWDLEELARGRPRNRNGGFSGGIPTWINSAIQEEAKRRLLYETRGSLVKHLPAAIETVYNLMTSDEIDDKGKPIVDARTRLAASTFIIEHFIGKSTAHVEVALPQDKVHSALVPAIILDDGADQSHLVLEGQVVSQDDEMEELEDE